MSITKITTPELLDFPNDSISSTNTSGTVIPQGYSSACNFPTSSSGVGLYQFENNATNTCTGITGTETNITYTTGNFNQAAVFNGTTSGVKIGDIFGFGVTTDFSFSVSQWINFTNLPPTSGANYSALLGRDTTFGGAYPIIELFMYNTGGGVCTSSLQKNFNGSFYYNSGYNSTAAPHTFTTSTWYHHVITYDALTKTTTLYVDGVRIGDYILDTPYATYTFVADLVIGSYDGSTNSFDGKIDQVRFYNKILSSSQITELYNETTTEAYRPTTSLDAGEFRFNRPADCIEYYDGSSWQQIADEYITGQPTTCVCNYPTQGLALYEFQDNTDDSCGIYPAVPTNITYTTGKYGKAAVFNGSSSKVSVNSVNQVFGAGDLAVSMWVLTDVMGAGVWYAAFNQDDYADGTNGLGMSIWVKDYKIEIFIRDGAGSAPQMTSAATVGIGSWHHVVLTRQYGVKWELYLDGSLADTDTTANILTANYQQSSTISYEGNNIGRSSYTPAISSPYWWDGQIDQTRFYNSYLSATQVSELYNETVCN